MNAEIAKTKSCPNCGHAIILNAWGIPVKHQSGDYMDAIERSRKKLEKELDKLYSKKDMASDDRQEKLKDELDKILKEQDALRKRLKNAKTKSK